jgi:hypothetical protein
VDLDARVRFDKGATQLGHMGIEPDRQAVWDWLLLTPIQELGGRTAVEIALAGEGEHVISLLESVAAGKRNL